MPYITLAFNLPIQQNFTYISEKNVTVGCRVEARFGARKLTGWVVDHPDNPPKGVAKIRNIERIVDTKALFDLELLNLARWMSQLTMCSIGEALACMLPGGRREVPSEDDRTEKFPPIHNLTNGQKYALKSIESLPGDWFYLHGSTGSGKTEVFLRAAEAVLSRGEGVIYLVPEIALSHHLVDGFSHRFRDDLAVIHSGLTPSRRLNEWRKIQNGSAHLVLGARSAVFAPLKRLGLIIIDEEHEGSYKSSSTPRYHARQIAMRRCREHSASLIMGSATPSVEAWSMAKNGKLHLLEINGRPGGGATPDIKLVDMKKEKGTLSQYLVERLSATMDMNRQALLFLNRRGFSHHYSCIDCGEGLLCRNCSIPMTFHKNGNRMLCHYCGYSTAPPKFCPACGSIQMRVAGFGTEKIEEEVQRLFPNKRVVRLDADSARRKDVLASNLRDFRSGDIDILLGTQMVAKGLNAPALKLAGIVLADISLNLPDFRSAERTFALIVQVAGRAGRFQPDGEVVIQTLRPDAFPVRFAAENRIEEFYNYEMEQRQILGFPPTCRLFRIVLRGRHANTVRSAAETLAQKLTCGSEDLEIMGPAECPIGMIAGEIRQHILLLSKAFDQTHATLSTAINTFEKPNGVRLEIDIDPVNLL